MNTEQAAIRNACATAAHDYNIFIVDKPENATVSGMMQYNQKYGFVHMDKANAQTFAHELGHGMGLIHSTDDPENIMHDGKSSTKWRMRKLDWDKVNDYNAD